MWSRLIPSGNVRDAAYGYEAISFELLTIAVQLGFVAVQVHVFARRGAAFDRFLLGLLGRLRYR